MTSQVRASVALGASYCCNVTMKSAYEVADVKRFCFETTDQQRNFIGGDSCDPATEDCEGMQVRHKRSINRRHVYTPD